MNYFLNNKEGDDYVKKILPLIHMWLPDDPVIYSDLDKVLTVDRNELCKI